MCQGIFNEGVFNENCIPGKKDSTEALVAKFDKLDMFDEIYVHVNKDQERLNASAYPQPRRRVYGMIHSENLSMDGTSVANLYHYTINRRIAKSMCVPMPTYMYDYFMKMIWERTRYLMPSAARDIPPNHCSQQFYYSKFKGGLNKHRDVKKKRWHIPVLARYTDCDCNNCSPYVILSVCSSGQGKKGDLFKQCGYAQLQEHD
jgi:hypothetical protein